MPQIKIQCPNGECGKVLAVDASLAGKKGKCSTCGTVFHIPAAVTGKPAADRSSRPETKSPSAAREAGAAQKRAASAPPSAPASKAPTGKPVARRADAARKPATRRPQPDDEILDADFLEEDEPIVEEPRRRAGRKPGAAAKRRRPAEDEYQDYEDYEDYEDDLGAVDDFEDYDDLDDYDRPARRSPGRGRKSKRGPSTTQKWRRVSVGMQISAISVCVLAGALLFLMLAEVLLEVAILNAASGGGGMGDSQEAFAIIYKIGRGGNMVALLALAAGSVFFVFAPGKQGTTGFGIATLVAATAWFMVDLVFRAIRALEVGQRSSEPPFDTQIVTLFPFQILVETGDKVLALIFELIGVTCLILLSLFLASAARANKDRGHAADCMKPVWLLSGYAAVVVLLYVLAFVEWEVVRGGGIPWWAYIGWLLHWVANGLYAVVLVFLIKALFYSRRTTG